MSALVGYHSPSSEVQDVIGWRGVDHAERIDVLAVEEPLEIRLAGFRVAVTMRTPGHDYDLASGFLFTEGILRSAADIGSIGFCPTDDADSASNIVNINPTDPAIVDPSRWQRNFFTTSSCGICGKASIDSVRQDAPPIRSALRLSAETLYGLDGQLRAEQAVFDRTGGLHAAGLFDAHGQLRAVREDVGRHNAVDKAIGHALRGAETQGLHPPPLHDIVLLVSGRASFEIVQKAWMAGIPVVAAVSAPSSLAVDLARSAGMTLVGFLRSGRFNVYAGAQRII